MTTPTEPTKTEENVEDTQIGDLIGSIQKMSHRPSWTEYFIITAYIFSKRSSCHKLHVGCVITKNNRIVTSGYNGHSPGCSHTSVNRDGHEQMTTHAEANAIIDAAKRGVPLEGCTAYITHFPCLKCTQLLIGAGIKEIVYANDYKNDELAYKLQNEAGVKVGKFLLFDPSDASSALTESTVPYKTKAATK